MLKLKQKVADIDGKKIAFVECYIDDGKFTYRCMFDKRTKPRFNLFAKSHGFKVGEVAEGETVAERTITL